MTPAAALAVQSERTREYVEAVLSVLINPNSIFSFGQHELMLAGEPMDRALLASMAEYILEKFRGNTKPLQLDFLFDATLVQTLDKDHPFVSVPQEDRLAHYNAVCRETLQKHKWPLSCVASPAAFAAGFSQEESQQFLNMVAAHDFSKLAFPAWFCATQASLVPGGQKGPLDFTKRQDCPFFKMMFSFVQVHRLLEITHHPGVLKQTTGQLHHLASAHLAHMLRMLAKFAYLEIICDTIETSLSKRCPTPDDDGAADSKGVNPWVDYTSKNFTEGKAQEIPEPLFGNILKMLFPRVAETATCSRDVINAVSAWTTADVRANSVVFEAIYKAFDIAFLQKVAADDSPRHIAYAYRSVPKGRLAKLFRDARCNCRTHQVLPLVAFCCLLVLVTFWRLPVSYSSKLAN